MTKEQLQSLLEQVHEALATIAMCDDLTFDRCQEIVAEAYVPLDEALALVRGSSEPKVCASRDADHCDYPDCEQHWELVVDWALAAMKKLHESAEPDTDHPEIPAIIPAAAFRAFVDEHARLMRIRASAPQGASRDASSALPEEQKALRVQCICGWQGKVGELTELSGRYLCPECVRPFEPMPTLRTGE